MVRNIMESRIPLEPRFAEYIEQRIANFEREAPERWRRQRDCVARFGALPLHVGGDEALGIRPDGSLVRWFGDQVLPIESPVDAAIALLLGAERYAELRAIVPERPGGVSDCLTCGGAGQIANAPEFICECGGLGWWPRSLTDLGVLADVRCEARSMDGA